MNMGNGTEARQVILVCSVTHSNENKAKYRPPEKVEEPFLIENHIQSNRQPATTCE